LAATAILAARITRARLEGGLVAAFAVGAAWVQVLLQRRIEGLVFAEMLLEPWLILQGLVPYRDFFQHHAPLVGYLVAAVLAFAPHDATTVVALHALLVAGLTVLVVFCGAALGGARLAVASGTAYVLLLPRLDGGLPWLEPFVAAGLLTLPLLLGASGVPASGRAALVAGLAIGVSALFKQTAAVALLAILVCTGWAALEGRLPRRVARERALACVAGCAVPPALALSWFAAQGALLAFVDQVVVFNLRYAREAALGPYEHDWPVVVLMVALPLIALAVSLASRCSRQQDPAAFVPLLALGSLAALLPRYAEFHYQQALPFLALCVGGLACWLPGAVAALSGGGALAGRRAEDWSGPAARSSAAGLRTAPMEPAGRSKGLGARQPAVATVLAILAAVELLGIAALTLPMLVRVLQAPDQARKTEEPLDRAVIGWLAPRVQPREPLLVLGDTRLHLPTGTLPATRHLYLFPWMYDGSAVRAEVEQRHPRYAVVDTAALDDPAMLAYLAERYVVVFESGAVQVHERRAAPDG
jgi:hypothetical protein